MKVITDLLLIFLSFFFCFSLLLVFYVLVYFFSEEKHLKLKENLYLVIPMCCICVWAFHYAVFDDYYDLLNRDYAMVYKGGKKIFVNPKNLYNVYGYVYIPSFALFMAVTYCLFPLRISWTLFYISNIIFGILFVRELDKILKFMNVKYKWLKLLFLIIASNGFPILQHFAWNQTKYLAGILIIYVLRREIQFRELKLKKNLKFYLINYSLFLFAISACLYFITLFLLIVFNDIPRNELFNKENFKKYGIVLLVFIAENFLFLIYPSMILEIFKTSSNFTFGQNFITHFWLTELTKKVEGIELVGLVNLVTNIIYMGISFFIIFNKKLKLELEIKFSFICFVMAVLYAHAWKSLIILLPFMLLLFVPYLNQNAKGIEFIKQNKIVLTGLISILGISGTSTSSFTNYPYWDGIGYAYTIYVSILICCVLVLIFRKKSTKDIVI